MSWNCIPLINHLEEIDFLCPWGGLPQYEPWSNFASGWLIFEGVPLTNWSSEIFVESPRNYLRLTESGRDFSMWLFHIDWIWYRFLYVITSDWLNLKRFVFLLNGVLRHSGLWCDQIKWLSPAQWRSQAFCTYCMIYKGDFPLLNRVFRHSSLPM